MGDINNPAWEALPSQTQEDVINWYNVREEDLDGDDFARLAKLVNAGQFQAWNCPKCGDRVFYGEPESWGDFQGVRQVDYVSYPGDAEKYTHKYLRQLCDYCRCHGG